MFRKLSKSLALFKNFFQKQFLYLNSFFIYETYQSSNALKVIVYSDIVDPAILRSGRLNKKFFIDFPDASERADILDKITKHGRSPRVDADVSFEEIARNPLLSWFTYVFCYQDTLNERAVFMVFRFLMKILNGFLSTLLSIVNFKLFSLLLAVLNTGVRIWLHWYMRLVFWR